MLNLCDDLQNLQNHLQEFKDDIVDILDVVEFEEVLHHFNLFRICEVLLLEDLAGALLRFDFRLERHDREYERYDVEQKAYGGGDNCRYAREFEESKVDEHTDNHNRYERKRAEVHKGSEHDSRPHILVAFFVKYGKRCLFRAHGKRCDARLVRRKAAETYFVEVVRITVSEKQRADNGYFDVLKPVLVKYEPCRVLAGDTARVRPAVVNEVFNRQPYRYANRHRRNADHKTTDNKNRPLQCRGYVLKLFNVFKKWHFVLLIVF